MGLFSAIKELNEKRKDDNRRFKEGGKTSGIIIVKGVDGVALDGNLFINDVGVLFKTIISNKSIYIPLETIVSIEAKTDEEVSRDVTLGRLLMVGVFAFGMKKKKVTKSHFLIINWVEDEIETETVIVSAGATNEAKRLIQIGMRDMGVTSGKMVALVADIPEQIKKLSELLIQGILTSEEFQTKKSELLARM